MKSGWMEKLVLNSVNLMAGFGVKISLLLILLALVQVLSGQQVVTLQADELPMGEVLDRIEQQSGLSFSYNSRLIDEHEKVSIYLERVSLEEALTKLFAGRKITFRVLEKQVVLKRARRFEVDVHAGVETDSSAFLTQKFTVSGYVKDAETGEVLIGATIAIPGGAEGCISNSYGFYSMTLRREVEELFCSYVGYRNMVIPVYTAENTTLHFTMEKDIAPIREVSIYSDQGENMIRTIRSSEERIHPESVRKMPALFGEKDVIKSLAAVPGIKFFGDGSTIFFVRGGSRDQNMITIDEAPVYNPTHLLGYFSTIVPDAIKDVKIYKGDFPANYGGRLSSLIDIRTKDGNMNHFAMDGSVGLLSSRLSLEGPLWKEHISFFASGRRSYIARPLQNWNKNITDLHFSDFHMKLNYKVNPKNRLFFSIYRGEDNFEAMNRVDFSTGINWTNATTTLRWNHLFSDRLFSNLTLLGSRYDYRLFMHKEENDYWNSRIDNLTLKYDFTYYVSPGYTLRFGFLTAGHFFDPGNIYQGGVEWDPGYDLSVRYAREHAMYFSNQFIISKRISIRAGLRLTAWQNMGPSTEYQMLQVPDGNIVRDSLAVRSYPEGEVYHQSFALDPRISVVYKSGEKNIFKLSYSRTSQFQYLITNSISPFTSLEVWLPAGPNVQPQFAHQFTLGYTRHISVPGLSLDMEAYFKRMNELIDYRDHARMLMNPLVEGELRFGQGTAYGLETILNKEHGRLSGWISYTLSRAISQLEDINGGDPYPSYSDRPHDFSAYISWAFHPRLTLSGNFIYMTGVPFSTPTGFYYYDKHQVPIYAARNNDRLPAYHRLDVALNWQLSKCERKYQHELIFSIFNLYNRINPVALHFNKTLDENGNFVVPVDYYSDPKLFSTQYYLYGIVPSISYHFYF
jgi:CarboxypepD_reg-like domain/TonB-dependent Receptor Plug Domain/Secretin and TonB N terminus short domain